MEPHRIKDRLVHIEGKYDSHSTQLNGTDNAQYRVIDFELFTLFVAQNRQPKPKLASPPPIQNYPEKLLYRSDATMV